MLEARVGRLEDDVKDIRATLGRLEPLIVELAHTTVKRSDIERLDRRIDETRDDMHALRGEMQSMHGEMREMRGSMSGLLQTKAFVMWIAGLFIAIAALVLTLGP